MEVYQSKKTAEELEFALGAIPSIGANGNWFIGGVDTGVYAGGIKVEGAEVGQTIVVKAVNENGMPTEWAAVDRERKTKYITVLDKTFETDTYLFGENMDLYFGDAVVSERHFFYKTPEGKQLKAKRVWAYFTAGASFNANHLTWSPYYADGDPNAWSFGDLIGPNVGVCPWNVGGVTLNSDKFWVVSFSADKSLAMAFVIGSLAWANSANSTDALPYKVLDAQIPHISGIKIIGTSNPIPAGSRMVIRAEVYEDE